MRQLVRLWTRRNDLHRSLFVRALTSQSHHGNRKDGPAMLRIQSKLCRTYSTSSPRIIDTTESGEILIRSPHRDIRVPDTSFTEYVFSKLDLYKDIVLMLDHMTGRTWTGSQLKDSAIRVASALHRLGLQKGDVVMMFSPNCPEYSMTFLACGALGVIVTTANPIYTSGELTGQLLHSKTVAVVTMPAMLPTVRESISSSKELTENVKHIISIGEADGCLPFSKLLDDDGTLFPKSMDVDPKHDTLVIPYSSGTTGLPKGVELTHSNLVANLEQMAGGAMCLEAERDCLLGLLPFYHIYGMVVVQFSSLTQGAKLVVVPRFEPEMFLTAIQQHKITYMHLVPPVVLFLAKTPQVSDYNTDSLRTLVCGAAPLGDGVTRELNDRLGVNLLQAYGLTEASPLTHIDQHVPKPGTIGRLLPSTVAKLIDVQTGQTVGPGAEGELLIKGPQIMKGYLDNPEATSTTVQDGWLHTGDLGYVDEEGYFTISDRLKELIKYKGFQVAPAELEHVLCTHPDVQDAAVVGVPGGESVGDIPRAFVVMKPDKKGTSEDIQKFVAEQVAPYKKLRGGVEFVTSIPKTASGKILRRELKKQYI